LPYESSWPRAGNVDVFRLHSTLSSVLGNLNEAVKLDAQAAIARGDLGKILIAESKPRQALAEIEEEPTEWAKLTGRGLGYHALGREQESNTALAGLIAKYHALGAYQIAEVYAYRGESDKSFEWLELAYEQRALDCLSSIAIRCSTICSATRDIRTFSRKCACRPRTIDCSAKCCKGRARCPRRIIKGVDLIPTAWSSQNLFSTLHPTLGINTSVGCSYL
jgi:hypothetical protein